MKLQIKLFIVSYGLLILTMFVLPFFSADGYSILRHTTSQLGAQKTTNAWIMNVVFALMGISSISAGWSHYNGFWLQQLLLLVFGTSLILVAIYSHAPIIEGLSYSEKSDQWHSFFATTTGFSFTFLAISTGFLKGARLEMWIPMIIGILATILSLLMFKFENTVGIWQRLMFISSFGWMIYEFKT